MSVLPVPMSISEFAASVDAGERFTFAKGDFLDAFYAADAGARQGMLSEPPITESTRTFAYSAAMAEHLARQFGLDVPAWAYSNRAYDHPPIFDHPGPRTEAMRLNLMVQSPPAFKTRDIFTTRNTLTRA